MMSDSVLEKKLAEYCESGVLVPRTENNRYLKVSYKGAGKLVSDKWNVKIYTSGAVVCNDVNTLISLRDDSFLSPNTSLKLIQIDDAGIGFPLCGVMVGACLDNQTVMTDTVDVKFFQGDLFDRKEYLNEYAKKGLQLLGRLKASSETHRIEICSGYINTTLRDGLRDIRYDVRVADIKGMLQIQLEGLFKDHVRKLTGVDLGYDPKQFKVTELGRPYYRALNWGLKNKPALLKSGWDSIKEKLFA